MFLRQYLKYSRYGSYIQQESDIDRACSFQKASCKMN